MTESNLKKSEHTPQPASVSEEMSSPNFDRKKLQTKSVIVSRESDYSIRLGNFKAMRLVYELILYSIRVQKHHTSGYQGKLKHVETSQ